MAPQIGTSASKSAFRRSSCSSRDPLTPIKQHLPLENLSEIVCVSIPAPGVLESKKSHQLQFDPSSKCPKISLLTDQTLWFLFVTMYCKVQHCRQRGSAFYICHSKEKKPLFCQCVDHCQPWRHSIAAFDLWAGQHCSGIPTGSRNSRPVLFTSRPSQSIQVASSTSMMSKNSMATSVTSTSFLVLLLSSHVASNPLPSNIFFPDTVKRFDVKWGKSFWIIR